MGRPKTGRHKKKPQPIVKLKPFSIKHYTFYPCSFSDSIKQGYKFFLFVRYHKNGFPVHELSSPRFKSRQEAENFVSLNQFVSHVVG